MQSKAIRLFVSTLGHFLAPISGRFRENPSLLYPYLFLWLSSATIQGLLSITDSSYFSTRLKVYGKNTFLRLSYSSLPMRIRVCHDLCWALNPSIAVHNLTQFFVDPLGLWIIFFFQLFYCCFRFNNKAMDINYYWCQLANSAPHVGWRWFLCHLYHVTL